jgi:hypothetical protein
VKHKLEVFPTQYLMPQQPQVISLIESNYDQTPSPSTPIGMPQRTMMYVPIVQPSQPSNNNNLIIFGTVAIVLGFFGFLAFALMVRRG